MCAPETPNDMTWQDNRQGHGLWSRNVLSEGASGRWKTLKKKQSAWCRADKWSFSILKPSRLNIKMVRTCIDNGFRLVGNCPDGLHFLQAKGIERAWRDFIGTGTLKNGTARIKRLSIWDLSSLWTFFFLLWSWRERYWPFGRTWLLFDSEMCGAIYSDDGDHVLFGLLLFCRG